MQGECWRLEFSGFLRRWPYRKESEDICHVNRSRFPQLVQESEGGSNTVWRCTVNALTRLHDSSKHTSRASKRPSRSSAPQTPLTRFSSTAALRPPSSANSTDIGNVQTLHLRFAILLFDLEVLLSPRRQPPKPSSKKSRTPWHQPTWHPRVYQRVPASQRERNRTSRGRCR